MEACFLTSNSFIKTIDYVHPINSRTLSNPRRKPISFRPRKFGTSSSITCCQMGSNSSEDDYKPMIDAADWRSFRARLVGGRQASRPESDGAGTDDDRLPQVAIGERWAHEIHEPERGCLLIATEKLDGVHIFERTVILLLSTGPVGPTGIILNRPSLMSIKETRSTVLDIAGTFSDRPLFFGGPLEEGVFLLSPSSTSSNSSKGDEDTNGVDKTGLFEEVIKGLYYGTKESVGCAAEMVKRDVVGVADFRFFDGYCGWEKEQLKDEIRAGYWTVAASSPCVIGLSSVGDVHLWDEILGLMGHRKVW